MKLHKILRALLFGAMTAALASCGLLDNKVVYPCPKAFILGDAGNLVRFKPGAGRDITDIVFEARIADFAGTCEYDPKKKKGVDISMNVAIDIRRGPASASSDISFEYFIAIPSYLPEPAGKRIFPVKGKFEDKETRLTYGDSVRMFIPLADPNDGSLEDIVIGFQLSPDEIEFNKSVRQR